MDRTSITMEFLPPNRGWKCSKPLILLRWIGLERVKGIEPSSQAWEARILPLNHTRRRRKDI